MTHTFTLTPGSYHIADACYLLAEDTYESVEVFDGMMEVDEVDTIPVGDKSFIYYNLGADGTFAVHDKNTDEELGVYGIEAANISIAPVEMAESDDQTHRFTLTEETTVIVYHDAIVIGDLFRVRL